MSYFSTTGYWSGFREKIEPQIKLNRNIDFIRHVLGFNKPPEHLGSNSANLWNFWKMKNNFSRIFTQLNFIDSGEGV